MLEDLHEDQLSGKRIVILLSGIGRGGAEKQAIFAANSLHNDGIGVTIMVFGGDLERKQEINGPELVVIERPRHQLRIVHFARVLRAVKQQNPEVIIGFLWRANLIAVLCSKILKARAIISIRNTNASGRARMDVIRLAVRMAEYIAERGADIVTSNTHQVCEKRKARNQDTTYIPNVVKLASRNETQPPSSTQKPGNAPPALSWLFVGRLHEQKNVEMLLTVFGQDRVPGEKLLIAGDGPLRGRLESQAKRQKIDGVTFLGAVADVRPLMAAADFVVLPSRWEGSPNVLLEAMSMGTPYVATPAGDVLTLTIKSMAGLCTRGLGPQDLSEGMAKARSLSTAELLALKRSGPRFINDNHSPNFVSAAWRHLIASLCPQPARDATNREIQ